MKHLNVVVVGHVDHGKSTVVGRLMADTGSLPENKLEQIKAFCEKNARPFEYAFVLDALKEEQAQGITIDAARIFFKTQARHYILIDAPGHVDFLKNMVTGAARAEAALLVIDAKEGVQENSRRHGYLLSLLGVKQVAVLVNKMDLIGYAQAGFDAIVAEYSAFLAQCGLSPAAYIPVAGYHGENLAQRSARMPWYKGPTALEALDAFPDEASLVDKPFRMPVQDIYKFTADDDTRRIVAGTVAAGTARAGDEVVFYPSRKKNRILTVERFNAPPQSFATAGQATGFTLEKQIYVKRGELACLVQEPAPHVVQRVHASLFWLGSKPMDPKKKYVAKIGTARVAVRIESIASVIDASSLDKKAKDKIGCNDVAECVLRFEQPVAVDRAEDAAETSRFVIVDGYELSGGGIVRKTLADEPSEVEDLVLVRDIKWEKSRIPLEKRAERLGQNPALVVVTGPEDADRKGAAKALETDLFESGRGVYYIGMGNLLHGVSADLPDRTRHWDEHLRRVGEVAHLFLDAGLIVILTAQHLRQSDLDAISTTIDPERIVSVWVGPFGSRHLRHDLQVAGSDIHSVRAIKKLLEERGVLFRGR